MALELNVDPAFYRANWRAERVGWGCILLIVLAGLAGVLGRGPLGHRTVAAQGVRVEYDRVLRRSSPGAMTIHLSRSALSDTLVRVWVSRVLMRVCDVQRITPMPVQVIDAGERVIFVLRVQPGVDSTTTNISCQSDQVGSYEGRLGVSSGATVPLRFLVLP